MEEPSSSPVENQDVRIRAEQEKQRIDLNAIEQVLSLDDFQQHADHQLNIENFLESAAGRINTIIPFNTSAIYLVNQETSDIELHSCAPARAKDKIEQQMAFLIENGYIAWALREYRGIIVYSNDVRYRILLHVIATYSRVRGIFVGLLPVKAKQLHNGSLASLTLILRNAATALESVEYFNMYQSQDAELHTRVDKKVDELRQGDLQLLNAQKMDAVSSLAGGIAHQFNNALFALTGGLDLIRLGANDGQDIDAYIDRIDDVVQRMSDLTLKLLAYSRGGKYKPQTIGANELVDKSVKVLKKPTEDFAPPVLKPPSSMYFVYVDVTQMTLALSAIMTNATEAIEPGGKIQVSWKTLPFKTVPKEHGLEETAKEYLALEIKDDGRGMDDITQQRIFEPFFSTKFHGRGLSMAAVYGIIKNHNGTLAIKSKVGIGTSVYIFLPTVN